MSTPMHSFTCQYAEMHTANESIKAILDKIEEGNQSSMSRRTKIPQPTIGRIASGRTVPDLLTVETIANAYGHEAWQLLVNGFDPRRPPSLRYMNGTEEALYLKFKSLQAELKNIGQ